MIMEKKDIEIPFGAFDSELGGFEYTIPEGYKAEIKDGKVVVRKTESEDERIKKEILNYIKTGTYHKDWVNWLEKQDDKISAIEGFETEFERQVSYLIASAINREHEYNEGYVKWTANALLNFAKHELEKQGEQKSAENEELTEFDKAVGVSIGTWNPKSPEQIQSVKAVSKKLLKLAKKQINDEQKPAEWSKDDEQYLLVCKNALSKYQVSDKWDAGIISRWLEERLKSLRPQNRWEPSEEQLNALYHIVSQNQKDACRTEDDMLLEELLEQLTKLRGK